MSPLKILYDHQIFEMQRIGGVSRGFLEIIQKIDNGGQANVRLELQDSSNEYLRESQFGKKLSLKKLPQDRFFWGAEFRGKAKLFNFMNKFCDSTSINKKKSIEAISKQDFDVFHPTYFDDYFLPYIGKKPFVLTVYDMIHETYPEHFPLGDTTAERKKSLACRASKILAISECTKKDIMLFYGIPSEKIQVVHWASSLASMPVSSDPDPIATLPKRYLLYVGARSGYKNFYFFINAISKLLHEDPNLHVVCTWMGFNNDEKNFFQHLGVDSQMHHRQVDDRQLGLLYKNALALVFPSFYEGFGLPILEAFANGCPVISSDASSLPEIAGDGAIYFKSKEVQSIRDAVLTLVNDPSLAKDLISRGAERLKKFSWDQTAEGTLRVYEEVARG